MLIETLIVWNKSYFGDIDKILIEIKEDLNMLYKVGDFRQLIESAIDRLNSLQDDARKWRIRKCQ